jgi:hypothetical protein
VRSGHAWSSPRRGVQLRPCTFNSGHVRLIVY